MDVANKDIFDVEKIVFSHKTKRFYFDDKDGKNQIEPVIHTKDIIGIVRVGTDDDNKYIFIIRLKDGREYSVELKMEDSFTPFLLKQGEADNLKAVWEAIPRYLDPLKGKRVEVCKTQYSPIFSVCDDRGDIINVCTGHFVFEEFDYTIEMISGFPSINIFEKNNEAFYNTAFGVRLIDSTKYNIDNGEYSTEDSVIIGSDSGDYFLTCVD